MGKITNGLGVLAAGMQLLHPGHLQHPTRPVIPNNESFWITQVEDDSSTTRLTGSSLLKPSAFFNLGTAYVDYVPLEQRVREGKKEENLEFTPEQQAVYDEISAIYGLYGVDFKFSKEGVFDQALTSGRADVPSDVVIFETPEGKYHLLEKALSILGTLYGRHINKYIDRLVEGTKGGMFHVEVTKTQDGIQLNREILIDTDRFSTYAAVQYAVLHEGIHASDVGYRAHTVDEYLALQLLKAKITLSLTNPHSVWNDHYSGRYDVWNYSPYLQIGAYMDEHMEELAVTNLASQNETLDNLISYTIGLGADGYLSDVDKIYIGLEAFRLKLALPDQRLPEGLEQVLSDSLFRMSTECFAEIATLVLTGTGYFDDPAIKNLLQEYVDIVRPADQRIDLADLIHELRYGYYEDTLGIPPYIIQSP